MEIYERARASVGPHIFPRTVNTAIKRRVSLFRTRYDMGSRILSPRHVRLVSK